MLVAPMKVWTNPTLAPVAVKGADAAARAAPGPNSKNVQLPGQERQQDIGRNRERTCACGRLRERKRVVVTRIVRCTGYLDLPVSIRVASAPGDSEAIRMAPAYSAAHHPYAEFLSFLGRFEENRKEFARAREIDPLSPHHPGRRGTTVFFREAVRPKLAIE